MLIPTRLHDGIEDGSVTLAFRCWRRPTVKSGGTLRWARGLLAIDEVAQIALADITDADARAAGETSRDAVLAELARRQEGVPYRIAFRHAGADPRDALAADGELGDADLRDLRTRLERKDRASSRGPWTRQVLRLIRDQPEVVARDLAAQLGIDRDDFKRDVRKLKALGLTISCDTGYRLSPRGAAFLAADVSEIAE